jgi:hypothetical protein
VALILYAGAQKNAGFFDPAWLDQPNFTKVLDVVPRERILAVIDSVFVSCIEQFKQQATEAPPLPYLERYLFNPLAARPPWKHSMNRPIAIRCSMRRGPVCRSMTQHGQDEFLARDHHPTRPHLSAASSSSRPHASLQRRLPVSQIKRG